MTDMATIEKEKFFKQVQKILFSIIKHKNYESFSNHLTLIEYSLLKMVGQADSYKDLPNCDVIGMLKKIKKRLLSYDR